jgi:hypothetical protein
MRHAGDKKRYPETICYRLPENYREDLCRRAQADGVSQGEFARRVLVDYLEDAVRRQLEHELLALQEEVALLRGDLATLTEALLVLASHGAPVTPMEARAWVEERLRQAGKGR